MRRRVQVTVAAALLAVVAVVGTQPALGDDKPGGSSNQQSVDKQLAQAEAILEGVNAKAQQAATALARTKCCCCRARGRPWRVRRARSRPRR
ncbi:hypothetical protein [Fodinicola feengrottensis]|uniref:hypothetical protein n=1 Tax=Fodinicola feengrottensis TaxID=435914 RepID=UPI0013D8CC25|nr:hypothetical protein [Fodinicola feengrottensis]